MKQRILIVDDSPLLRKTARRAAVQAGAEPERIREAGNGREALAALAAEPVDSGLLDINMPVMDGFEFLEARARAPSPCAAKIALVTTEGNKERLARAEQLGVVDYLRKPFAPEELRALVTKWFEGS
ncbi:MAG: response regulator [Planctomycetota bacterium]